MPFFLSFYTMKVLLSLFILVFTIVKANEYSYSPIIKSTFDIFDANCPPCFNCMLPGFECLHFANCSEYDGKCNCPSGFGGDDCKQPCKVKTFSNSFYIIF